MRRKEVERLLRAWFDAEMDIVELTYDKDDEDQARADVVMGWVRMREKIGLDPKATPDRVSIR